MIYTKLFHRLNGIKLSNKQWHRQDKINDFHLFEARKWVSNSIFR